MERLNERRIGGAAFISMAFNRRDEQPMGAIDVALAIEFYERRGDGAVGDLFPTRPRRGRG